MQIRAIESTFSCQSEWLSLRHLTANVREDVGKKEPLFTIDGSGN